MRATALHPGGIKTELGRHMAPGELEALRRRGSTHSCGRAAGRPSSSRRSRRAPRPRSGPPSSPPAEEVGGRYCEDCHVADVTDGADSSASPACGPTRSIRARQGALGQERGDGRRALPAIGKQARCNNGASDISISGASLHQGKPRICVQVWDARRNRLSCRAAGHDQSRCRETVRQHFSRVRRQARCRGRQPGAKNSHRFHRSAVLQQTDNLKKPVLVLADSAAMHAANFQGIAGGECDDGEEFSLNAETADRETSAARRPSRQSGALGTCRLRA